MVFDGRWVPEVLFFAKLQKKSDICKRNANKNALKGEKVKNSSQDIHKTKSATIKAADYVLGGMWGSRLR